jgi:hypothetical protein
MALQMGRQQGIVARPISPENGGAPQFPERLAQVRFGSLADIEERPTNVRFAPENAHH